MFLCFTMLLGTTYAWFTDSVASSINTIVAGNLDVELYHTNNKVNEKKVTDTETLFTEVEKWEPGVMVWEKFTVRNEGDLALKYEFALNATNATVIDNVSFAELLMVSVIKDADFDYTRESVADIPVENWTSLSSFTETGELEKNEKDIYGVVIYWMPSSRDNVFNMNNEKTESSVKVDIGVTLLATQMEAEFDSFGKDYDANAQFPVIAVGTLSENAIAPIILENIDEETGVNVIVSVPADASAGNYRSEVTEYKLETVDGATVVNTNISLYKDGTPVEDGATEYSVTLKILPMSNITKVMHKEEEITNYDYNVFTGVITFKTTSFSPFAVEYVSFAEDVMVEEKAEDEYKIVKGTFENVNPATLDHTLADVDSEYIAINYEKNGNTYYVVSERAATAVVQSTDSDYTAENGNYTVTNANGKLYKVISDLKNNEHSTVYILPGTYNEATTVNVYSSMDIIGLGDVEDIKIVKTSSSSSNRHLFNCNGTKADYIEVTISNMTLDVREKTTNNKDNAAVQSIRKTKVKCYDLDIIKGTALDAVAFYVNGNNAIDGVKYTAYLYVESCTLNTTREFGIVTTAGNYKFYHSGLTYNNGTTAYTKNSGSILNKTLDADVWDW